MRAFEEWGLEELLSPDPSIAIAIGLLERRIAQPDFVALKQNILIHVEQDHGAHLVVFELGLIDPSFTPAMTMPTVAPGWDICLDSWQADVSVKSRRSSATHWALFLLNLRDVILREMNMRSAPLVALLGASAFIAVSAIAQTNDAAPAAAPAYTPTAAPTSGSADLCQELLAYAEETATEPPTSAPADQASPTPLRREGDDTGTQGGGSVDASTSTDTSSQEAAPPTAPVATGAAPEAASSPHASDPARVPGASPTGTAKRPGVFTFAGGVTLQQLQDIAESGDRQACRRMAQGLRRAGADMPAELIALAAYEPDPEKRQ